MEASFQRIKKNLFGGISTEGWIIRIHNLKDFICVQINQREKLNTKFSLHTPPTYLPTYLPTTTTTTNF